MAIKKIYRTNPDPILVKADNDQAQGALAKIAHINWLITQIDEPPVEDVSISGSNFDINLGSNVKYQIPHNENLSFRWAQARNRGRRPKTL